MLGRLGIGSPTPRPALVVRSRISLAETAALLWPDGRSIPRRGPERAGWSTTSRRRRW
ncbi:MULTISPECIES: hypothetical protein [Streptomyces]|uniref:hypothetical protein n=1 Tax=Streptomyces TaxID=1883 RepID=UPI00384C1172